MFVTFTENSFFEITLSNSVLIFLCLCIVCLWRSIHGCDLYTGATYTRVRNIRGCDPYMVATYTRERSIHRCDISLIVCCVFRLKMLTQNVDLRLIDGLVTLSSAGHS